MIGKYIFLSCNKHELEIVKLNYEIKATKECLNSCYIIVPYYLHYNIIIHIPNKFKFSID